MEISNWQLTIIVLTVILFSAIVAIMLFYAYEINKLDIFSSNYSDDLAQFCSSIKKIIYRKTVYVPDTNGVYEENLSEAAVSLPWVFLMLMELILYLERTDSGRSFLLDTDRSSL